MQFLLLHKAIKLYISFKLHLTIIKNPKMKTQELLKKLKGIQTIESIKDILSVSKKKAIYYIHRLRKKGMLKQRNYLIIREFIAYLLKIN